MEQGGPGEGDHGNAMEQAGPGDGEGLEGGADGRRAWLRQKVAELYAQMCDQYSPAVPAVMTTEFYAVVEEMR